MTIWQLRAQVIDEILRGMLRDEPELCAKADEWQLRATAAEIHDSMTGQWCGPLVPQVPSEAKEYQPRGD